MKQIYYSLFICLLFTSKAWTQPMSKKTMDHSVYAEWKSIQNSQISNNGEWVVYQLKPGEGDAHLHLYQRSTKTTKIVERGSKAAFSADNRFLVFHIQPMVDSVKAMKRRKMSADQLPLDTLAILNLQTKQLEKIPHLKKYQLPTKWNGTLAYQLKLPLDTLAKESTTKAPKAQNDKNGFPLIIHQLTNGQKDTFPYVSGFELAKEKPALLFHSAGQDSTFETGVYFYNCSTQQVQPLLQGKGTYTQLTLSHSGQRAAFLADRDTNSNRIPPFELYTWQMGNQESQRILHQGHSFLPTNWIIGQHQKLSFSENEERLFFGIAPPPILKDTTLLDEEIVKVEVWNYKDARLHTQQKIMQEAEEKRAYTCVYQISRKRLVQLATEAIPILQLGNEGNADKALGIQSTPYLRQLSWEGFPEKKDLFVIDLENGQSRQIQTALQASPRLSPNGQYAYWYNQPDSTWEAYDLRNNRTISLTGHLDNVFYDELNDRPTHPANYGILGWTLDDQHILIQDRYDIWQIDPQRPNNALLLTKGRSQKKTYRYIKLDREERAIDPKQTLLLHQFDHHSKAEGYARLNLQNGQINTIVEDDFAFTRRVQKAKDAAVYLFRKGSFQQYPDLLLSKANFQSPRQISQANPQQSDYNWGSIELVEWTAADGQQLRGLLAKPANFDPNKKYPMIVNFYERSSDRLHTHRAPYPHRSTINYTFYTNRGYVIFNPDVPYRIGYPGESAFNAVVSGVTAMIDKGFVDKERIGLQGHSWGGYQAAYLVTKTDLFKCAEAGAPVVNMISAYGGIRWRSGLSRMFQYEHTQSRIGGTLWEYPLRYIENSPIFFADKINTPILILHNDKDGAVPWYQGIEFFVALRRLNKPAWMLNYNDEPHWPLKRQNRIDFNTRMQQFFDYYLQGKDQPRWMERGVPAIEKGILQGLESVNGQ